MRYQLADGTTSVKFARPAHGLLALWGDEVIAIEALGLKSSNITLGHRFMSEGPITIASADTYEPQLHAEGRSEEHTSELQSLMRNSSAVFCLKKKKNKTNINQQRHRTCTQHDNINHTAN